MLSVPLTSFNYYPRTHPKCQTLGKCNSTCLTLILTYVITGISTTYEKYAQQTDPSPPCTMVPRASSCE